MFLVDIQDASHSCIQTRSPVLLSCNINPLEESSTRTLPNILIFPFVFDASNVSAPPVVNEITNSEVGFVILINFMLPVNLSLIINHLNIHISAECSLFQCYKFVCCKNFFCDMFPKTSYLMMI